MRLFRRFSLDYAWYLKPGNNIRLTKWTTTTTGNNIGYNIRFTLDYAANKILYRIRFTKIMRLFTRFSLDYLRYLAGRNAANESP